MSGQDSSPQPAPAAGNAPAAYNPIFEKFVDGAQDDKSKVLGLVAYGIYKQRKREWASEIRQKFNRSPNQQELDHYISSWTAGQIEGAKTSAIEVLTEFADSVERDAEPRILKDALKGSTLKNIAQSIAANFLYTLLLIGFAVILAVSGIDLVGILQNKAIAVQQEPSANNPSNSGSPNAPSTEPLDGQ